MLYEARGRHVSRTNVSQAREAGGQQMRVYDYLLCWCWCWLGVEAGTTKALAVWVWACLRQGEA